MPARKRNTGDDDVPDGPSAKAARQQLGRLLRELREGRDITQEDAAHHIERVPSTMYRIEDGQPGVRIRPGGDVARLCDLYGVTDEELRTGLMALAEETRNKDWFQPNRNVLPPKFNMFLSLESDASELSLYELERVPGLLQTEAYARALFRIPGPDGRERDQEDIAQRLELRLQLRQAALRRKDPRPPRFDVLVGEAVLRRPVGGPAVMAEQLRHINKVTAELMHVSVRVVPFSAGLQEGVVSGPFIIMRFPGSQPTKVWVDAFIGNLLFDKREVIDRYDTVYADIYKHSLSEDLSREAIEQAAEEFDNHDGPGRRGVEEVNP